MRPCVRNGKEGGMVGEKIVKFVHVIKKQENQRWMTQSSKMEISNLSLKIGGRRGGLVTQLHNSHF